MHNTENVHISELIPIISRGASATCVLTSISWLDTCPEPVVWLRRSGPRGEKDHVFVPSVCLHPVDSLIIVELIRWSRKNPSLWKAVWSVVYRRVSLLLWRSCPYPACSCTYYTWSNPYESPCPGSRISPADTPPWYTRCKFPWGLQNDYSWCRWWWGCQRWAAMDWTERLEHLISRCYQWGEDE